MKRETQEITEDVMIKKARALGCTLEKEDMIAPVYVLIGIDDDPDYFEKSEAGLRKIDAMLDAMKLALVSLATVPC